MPSPATTSQRETLQDQARSSKGPLGPGAMASVVICWTIMMGAILIDQRLSAERTGAVVAVFSPWSSAEEISKAIHAARGSRVSGTRYSKAFVLHSDEEGFAGRLESEGAIAVVAPMGPVGVYLLGNRAADYPNP